MGDITWLASVLSAPFCVLTLLIGVRRNIQFVNNLLKLSPDIVVRVHPVHYGRPAHCIFALWFLSIFFYSSPNLSRRRLDVYHTSTHDVALVRI